MTRSFRYQRRVIGYHGCSRAIMERVLLDGDSLRPSRNKYDWLGHGIYFWEFGPERAREWARAKAKRQKKSQSDIGVLGAIIELGHCFDLTDTRYTALLQPAWRVLDEAFRAERISLPENHHETDDGDLLLRELDCAVINAAIGLAAPEAGTARTERYFQTVRGAFVEGPPAFPGACVRERTHVQIAVRDPDCIVGYFRPTLLGAPSAEE